MARRGRFGKYGDFKRKQKLRSLRFRPPPGTKTKMGTRPGRLPRPEYHSAKPSIEVREAVASDTPFIRSLSTEAFQQYGPYDTSIPEWLSSGLTITLMATKDGKPAGFAMLGVGLGRGELLAIAVSEEFRRQSIGSTLLRSIEKKAWEVGIGRIILHTAVENSAAKALFRKMGYRELEVKKGFYPAGQDALMMAKDLSTVPE